MLLTAYSQRTFGRQLPGSAREAAAWRWEVKQRLTLGLGTGCLPTDVLKARFYTAETDTVSMVRTLQMYLHSEKLQKLNLFTGYANF